MDLKQLKEEVFRANLELVQRLYALVQTHPRVDLHWIKAHDGSRWNEYADALASAYLRSD